jgi:hypothetical protein
MAQQVAHPYLASLMLKRGSKERKAPDDDSRIIRRVEGA